MKIYFVFVCCSQVEMDKTKQISLDDFIQIVQDYAEK